MRNIILGPAAVVFLLATASAASAFDCPNRFAAAEAAIEDATKAMEQMSDETAKGLVHTFIDDAKMLLNSGKHNHEKPAAGKFDHGRAMAKANAAEGYAKAAKVLAAK